MIKYQGKTIVGIAHERGANGHIKKKDTAWAYLLDNLKHMTGQNLRYRPHAWSDKQSYKKSTWESRLNSLSGKSRLSRADQLCHAHGYQLRTEVPGEVQDNHYRYQVSAAPILETINREMFTLRTLPRAPQDWSDPDYYFQVGGRVIVLRRTDSAEWVGKSHWPKTTTITRTAILLTPDWDDLSDEVVTSLTGYVDRGDSVERYIRGRTDRDIDYKARGNWLLKIIIELLGINPERVRGKAKIQLDPHFRIERVRSIHGVEIWMRTLAGDVYDYCAVRGKDTYHAESPIAAVQGLAAKLAAPDSRKARLDMDYALGLGFCRTGVEQFCEDYDLDAAGVYTRAELREIVNLGNGQAEKYLPEFRKAGILV